MAAYSRKFFLATVCLLFAFSAAMGFLLNEIAQGHYNLPEQEILRADSQPQKPRVFCWEERYALCQLYDLDCNAVQLEGDAATETMLRELPLYELANRYPGPDWSIREEDNVITICRNLAGLCEIHRRIYHLGRNENGEYLAVYYGPSAVGNAAGAFLVTDIAVEKLGAEQLLDLEQGRLEYYSQDELISMLDNLSEL
jgi:hypothetical protein